MLTVDGRSRGGGVLVSVWSGLVSLFLNLWYTHLQFT